MSQEYFNICFDHYREDVLLRSEEAGTEANYWWWMQDGYIYDYSVA